MFPHAAHAARVLAPEFCERVDMLLGFKRQFAPFIEDGSKTHTIRAIRKIMPKAGECCHCYVDPRQKTMRLLGRWPCIRVQSIRIDFGENHPLRVWIDGVELDAPEVEALLRRDGFRSSKESAISATLEARDFWKVRLIPGPWDGHLIHWDFNEPLAQGAGPRAAAGKQEN